MHINISSHIILDYGYLKLFCMFGRCATIVFRRGICALVWLGHCECKTHQGLWKLDNVYFSRYSLVPKQFCSRRSHPGGRSWIEAVEMSYFFKYGTVHPSCPCLPLEWASFFTPQQPTMKYLNSIAQESSFLQMIFEETSKWWWKSFVCWMKSD